MPKLVNRDKEYRATYVVVDSWWDYEPSVTPFNSRKQALECYAERVKNNPEREPFLAKIIKGKITFRKG